MVEWYHELRSDVGLSPGRVPKDISIRKNYGEGKRSIYLQRSECLEICEDYLLNLGIRNTIYFALILCKLIERSEPMRTADLRTLSMTCFRIKNSIDFTHL